MKVANYNFQQDLSKVILWQYDDAEKFKSIVANEQEFMDNAVTKFWDDFNTNVFNLNTCNTFGLELWGKLLNIARPTYNDGGTKIYYGLGYKVIKYHQTQGRRDMEIGNWSLKYNEFNSTIYEYLKNEIINNG